MTDDLVARTVGRPPDKEVVELFEWLNQMRETEPAGYDENAGMWQVFGYREAQRILAEPKFSSDARRARLATGADVSLPPVIERLTVANLLSAEGAGHRRFRGLLTQAFSRRHVDRLQPRIRRLAAGLLDDLDGAERFDLLERFSYPLPMMVLCELLGVPHDDRRAFQSWAEALTAPDEDAGSPDGVRRLAERLSGLEDYLHELVGRRRREPENDLLSTLISAGTDGDRLTGEEIVSLAAVMLLAGHGTTTMMLSNLVLCLDEHPAVAHEVRADRSLIPGAIEEVFRYRGPLPMALRVATEPLRVGDGTVEAGAPVAVWMAAAHWDPEQFPEPARFDVRRSPNRHLGFGHGMHFCLGAPLARVVGEIAVSTLMDRCSVIAVPRDETLTYRAPRANLAPDALPVEVRWAPR